MRPTHSNFLALKLSCAPRLSLREEHAITIKRLKWAVSTNVRPNRSHQLLFAHRDQVPSASVLKARSYLRGTSVARDMEEEKKQKGQQLSIRKKEKNIVQQRQTTELLYIRTP